MNDNDIKDMLSDIREIKRNLFSMMIVITAFTIIILAMLLKGFNWI